MGSRKNACSSPRSWGKPLGVGLAVVLLILVLVPADLDAKKKSGKTRTKIKNLPEDYRVWIQAVELIISKEEKLAFLEIEKDYQRDAFIERFWKVRDPYPRTGRNEYREAFEARMAYSLEVFGSMDDDRSRVLLMNGEPLARVELDCAPSLKPLEVWQYKGSDTYRMEFLLLFYQDFARGPFRLYEPFVGLRELRNIASSVEGSAPGLGGFFNDCGVDADAARAAVNFINGQGGQLGAQTFFIRLLAPVEEPPGEWVATFETYSTDLPEGADTFEASLELDYPGRHQSRTILQGNVTVPIAELKLAELAAHSSYNLMLNGEILREDKLFDTFRYKYDLPSAEIGGDQIPLVFQRYLRSGTYKMVVKVEDVNSGRLHRSERQIEVPHLEHSPPPTPADPETARILAEANAAISSGENTLKLTPLQGKWQTGLVRIDALSTGTEIAKVSFFLDQQPILTKKNPPWNVELDLGQVPRSRVLRVEAYDDAGEEIAADEVLLNGGPHRFGVRLVEPRKGKTYRASLRAQADPQVPEGEVVERVEFFLNETLVATVYQPPYIQPIILPENELVAYVRAVAYTPDGHSTEDLVFINSPDNLDEIDVDFVELYTSVLDRGKHPVEGLTVDDFSILEDGVEQEPMRFEVVRNLPIHATIMLDVSASMEEELEDAQAAALRFFEQAVTPKDRAAIVTFNDHPNLAAKFTNKVKTLAGGLAGLKAERGTALYDSLIFTLYYFNGIKGQRAVLLLSDGKDESSRYEFDDALEYAHRAGVAIYSIGLKIPRTQLDARRKLTRFAEETGGRSFFIEEAAELGAIYEAIQRELRSRYLIAYQSNNTSGSKRFRTIEVKMTPSGLEAKTLRGYYPS